MNRILVVTAFALFTTALFVRSVEPLIPQFAQDFRIDAATAALVSSAFSLPYAVIQPVLGALGDMLGKYRMMKACLVILAVANLASAYAPTFDWLLASRVLAGVAAGGLLPMSLAVAGDVAPMQHRQVAMGRLLAATLMGNILGASVAGVASEFVGWRNVFLGSGLVGFAVYIVTWWGYGPANFDKAPGFALSRIVPGFRAIFANPLAKICYSAVFLEGLFIYGLLPFAASLLVEAGETRPSIAGIVISGFGVGGIIYTIFVSGLIARLGERRLMTIGPLLMSVGFIPVAMAAAWQVEFVAFVVLGLGFFMLHACIQVNSTELAPSNHASAVSLHAGFFFLGHSLGPIVYGYVIAQAGVTAMLLIAAVVINLVGLMCRLYLRAANAPG